MVKEELFRSPRWGHYIRAFGTVPVRRGVADRQALRQAEALLGEGFALGMFPEGTRSRTAQMQHARTGATLRAVRTGAPLLPVGIAGTEKLRHRSGYFTRPSITVTIGEPFHLPPTQGRASAARLTELTDLIMERIAQLLPPSYRGVYGGLEAQETGVRCD